jgi:hypothetical protein
MVPSPLSLCLQWPDAEFKETGMGDQKDQSEMHENPTPEVLASDGGNVEGPGGLLDDPARRSFLKRAAIGGGAALAGGAASYGAAKASLQGRVVDDYPMVDEKIFKPKDQRDCRYHVV